MPIVKFLKHTSILRRLVWIACALITSSVHSLAADATHTTTRTDLYFGLAQGNYLIGDLQAAKHSIEQILRIEPNHLPTIKLQTRILLDQNNPQAALENLKSALKTEPPDNEIKLLQALAFAKNKQPQAAKETAQHVLQNSPENSREKRAANQLIGLLNMDSGNWDQAAENFSSIQTTDPQTADANRQLISEAYLAKAKQAAARSQKEQALSAIDQAIETHQTNSGSGNFERLRQLKLARAELLTRFHSIDEAIAELQSLLTAEPNNLQIRVTLASLYASHERWESLDQIIQPIAEQPGLTDIARYLEGRAALAQNRIGRARLKFEQALEIQAEQPNRLTPALHFYHAQSLHQLQRTEEAKIALNTALQLNFKPETNNEVLIASRLLIQFGQADQAIPLLESIILSGQLRSHQTWSLLGHAHQTIGQFDKAISAYNESLQTVPTVEAFALRGSLLRRLGQIADAINDFENALQLDPQNHGLLCTLALTQLEAGDITRAATTFQQAHKLQPNRQSYSLFSALLQYTLGNHSTAKQQLETYPKNNDNFNTTEQILRYCLDAKKAPSQALEALKKAANQKSSPPEIGYYYGYASRQLSRKETLDYFGKADTPRAAQKRICAAAFWMSQIEANQGHTQQAEELLLLCIQNGTTEWAEYQLAKYLSNKTHRQP